MKLGEYLRVAIENGNWQKVCNVYRQITGQYIEPPQPKAILSDVDMTQWENQDTGKEIATPSSPAHIEIDAETEWATLKKEEEENSDEDETEPTGPVDVETLVEAPRQAPDTTSFILALNAIEDFVMQHPKSTTTDPTQKRSRKESMKIPVQRTNRFIDDETIATQDSVKVNPKLGVQNPVPRGHRDLIDGAKETGSKVSVICSMCGQHETVSETLAVGWHKDAPSLSIEDRQNTYKCNDCQTPNGRAKLLRAQRNGNGKWKND